MGEDGGREQPIIVIKKAAAHHGHHGGAWKVAYADFVTAMMALFMVLWLLNSSQETQKAIGGYFSDPEGNGKLVGSDMAGAGGESILLAEHDLEKIKDRLTQALKESTSFHSMQDRIVMLVTGEGLRIELLEGGAQGTFFESGSPVPTPGAMEILARLAGEIGKLPNRVYLEGHTDASPYAGEYGNWELSADRANTARRIMQAQGVRVDQVGQVRGFADQRPRNGKPALDPSNRRISIIIQHLNGASKSQKAPPPPASSGPPAHGH